MGREGLARLVDVLRESGRRVIAPVHRDGAIAYEEIKAVDELAVGWRDEQEPGRYRLRQEGSDVFGYTPGPASWKQWTFPSSVPIGRARHQDGHVTFEPLQADVSAMAFLGVRACEIAALRIQDGVLADGPVPDPDYVLRRGQLLVVAVQCTVAASTCFCASMATGPEVREGFDLSLTEIPDGFLVEAGSVAGHALLDRLPTRAAAEAELATARMAVAAVREQTAGQVAADGLPARLRARLDDPHWAEIAERCLACANCTLVCPTCFCSSVTQRTDLRGSDSISSRTWDSCFSGDFAKVAGGNFRPRRQDRYRQWLTHKFSTWVDQFGTSGCVGCGRCVTWCPVGIDVREELMAIAGEAAPPHAKVPLPVASAPGAFTIARVAWSHPETADTTTLRLVDVDPAILAGRPGQFVMVARPGSPSAPISISRYDGEGIELTIRAAGAATTALTHLTSGEEVGLRGPLGRGWPLGVADGRDVIVVAGGIGLPPLRPLIETLLAERTRYGALRIFYGARTPADRCHLEDLAAWMARDDMELAVTVDRGDPRWTGPVGVVTHLFDRATWSGRDAVAYVVGPERMMQATASALVARGVPADRTFLSLERHMECGVGLCGHCQMGPFFVCRDGPVFPLTALGDLLGREGI